MSNQVAGPNRLTIIDADIPFTKMVRLHLKFWASFLLTGALIGVPIGAAWTFISFKISTSYALEMIRNMPMP